MFTPMMNINQGKTKSATVRPENKTICDHYNISNSAPNEACKSHKIFYSNVFIRLDLTAILPFQANEIV